MRRFTALAVAGLTLAACGPQAPKLDNELRPTAELADLNDDPAIVEVKLAASPGTTAYLPGKAADVWGYRDASKADSVATVPGPLLRAKVGDTVIVHFTNELPEPTTIHWHGLRLPNQMDGSSSSQAPVDPGKEFEYRFTLRDAGSFWFHPHIRGEVQIERGLYAPFIVEGGAAPDVHADRYFVLDDVKLSASGQLSADTDALDEMMGRQGNVLLVNGQKDAQLLVPSNARERWRFVNSANGRYFNLELPGHRFTVIGWDGGLLPEPYETDRLLIAPGERYEVLVSFHGSVGEKAALQTVYYDRGHNQPDPGAKPLLTLFLGDPLPKDPAPLPTTWGNAPDVITNATTSVRNFVLKERELADGSVTFSINDQVWPFNSPVMVKQGDTEIWEVKNEAEMDHPFHLHGMFFDVLSVNGVPPEHRGWKDTVNIPQMGTVRFAVRYEALGMWMFHCHILEHAELGMMGDLMVMSPQ